MLDVNDLDYEYQNSLVLNKVSFCLKPGALLHLRGPNGSGKTTLLKLLAGLLRPTTGQICYDGMPIEFDLSAYQQRLCYLGHKIGVSLLLTVEENYMFTFPQSQQSFQRTEMIKRLALNGLEHVPCYLLSMGQRRRVALARLLTSASSLWLLDEPLVGLDKESIALLMGCIETHLAEQGQVILTSHQHFLINGASYEEYEL